MFGLITNETCFTVKRVHIRRRIASKVIETCFFLSMIETTSRGRFDLSQTKHVSANVVFLLKTTLPFSSRRA